MSPRRVVNARAAMVLVYAYRIQQEIEQLHDRVILLRPTC
jgi:hypothetical protein